MITDKLLDSSGPGLYLYVKWEINNITCLESESKQGSQNMEDEDHRDKEKTLEKITFTATFPFRAFTDC